MFRLNVLSTRRSFVQRDAKKYLVSIDANLCFVCLICIPNLLVSEAHGGAKVPLSPERC